MLTRCYAYKKEFTCNFTVSKKEVLLESYEGKDKVRVLLNDIVNADLLEDRLLIRLRGGEEIAINVKTGIMENVHYIMQFVEINKQGKLILKKTEETSELLSKIFRYGYEILSLLSKENFPDWMSCERKALKINELLKGTHEFFNAVSKSVQELLSNTRRRFVFGVKVSIKVLFREALNAGRRLLREGVNYVDLSSIPEVVALIHSSHIARKLNLVLEEKRLMSNLLLVAERFHKSLFPLDDSLVRELNNWLVEALSSFNDPEELIDDYITKLGDCFRNYYNIKH